MTDTIPETRTPAMELRDAAKTLREGRRFLGSDISTYDHDYLAWLGSLVASVNPLADWLEEFADWYDASHFHDLSGRFHEECGADDCTCFDSALAVARAINGKAA